MAPTSARLAITAGMAMLAVGYAWFVTGLYPFTWPALAATVAAGAVVVAAARRGATPLRVLEPKAASWRTGAVVWAMLFLALGAWELAAFLQHPRSDHPTLSSLANSVFDSHATRAGAFLAWLAVGAALARR